MTFDRVSALGSFLVSLLLFAFGAATEAAAQGKFCATYNDDATPEDCSFTSLQMCRQSVSGVGGYCAPAIDAPPMPPPPLFRFGDPLTPPAQPTPLFGPPDAFPPAAVPPPPSEVGPINNPNFDQQTCGNPPSPPCL
jgi:hypothetical protein